MNLKWEFRLRLIAAIIAIATFNWTALFLALFLPLIRASNGNLNLLWGSIAASSTQSFNVTYIPEWIAFTIGTVPTSFQINVQGDGITFNLDGTGLTNMKNIRTVSQITNGYLFQLANGLINGKNATVTIANAAAATLNIYGWSNQPGNMYMTYLTQKALANSGISLRKFAYAAFPSAGTADIFQLEYNSGVTQLSYRDDLAYMLQYTQANVGSVYNFDNIAPTIIDTLTFTPTADQSVYVMQYQASKGVVNSAVIANGQ